MNAEVFDLAVIGGGPAGAAAAIRAADLSLSVVLFEPRMGPGDKPCGEGIMPEGVVVLARLGLDDLLAAGQPFEKLRFFIADRVAMDVPLPGKGMAFSRPVLQSALDGAVRTRPAVRRVAARASVSAAGGGFFVESDAYARVFARSVVFADGMTGTARADRRETLEPPGPAHRIGIRARFTHGKLRAPCVQIHMGDGAEVYLTPVDDNVVTAAVLTANIDGGAGRPVDIFMRTLAEHVSAREFLGEMTTEPEARVVASRVRAVLSGQRWFRAGDAGIAVDPIVGCGVTQALESGVLAAESARAVIGGVDPDQMARDYAVRCRRTAASRLKLAGLLRFLSSHERAARTAAFFLRRAPRILEKLVHMAG